MLGGTGRSCWPIASAPVGAGQVNGCGGNYVPGRLLHRYRARGESRRRCSAWRSRIPQSAPGPGKTRQIIAEPIKMSESDITTGPDIAVAVPAAKSRNRAATLLSQVFISGDAGRLARRNRFCGGASVHRRPRFLVAHQGGAERPLDPPLADHGSSLIYHRRSSLAGI